MPLNRPVWMLASLAASVPAHAETLPAASGAFVARAFGSTAMLVAAMLLFVGLLLVLGRRGSWRWGAVAIVGGCALLGGDVLLDGALTAIAVSP